MFFERARASQRTQYAHWQSRVRARTCDQQGGEGHGPHRHHARPATHVAGPDAAAAHVAVAPPRAAAALGAVRPHQRGARDA